MPNQRNSGCNAASGIGSSHCRVVLAASILRNLTYCVIASAAGDTKLVVLDVEGMMCMKNCGATVTSALRSVEGVTSVEVDGDGLREVRVGVRGGVSVEALVEALEGQYLMMVVLTDKINNICLEIE